MRGIRTFVFALTPAVALLAGAEAALRAGGAFGDEARAAARPLRRIAEDGTPLAPGEGAGGRAVFLGPGAPGGRPFQLPLEKGEDEVRILALGGSSVYGWPYSLQEAFPARLQARLQERFDDRASVAVVNGGVPGIASDRVRARLEALLELQPDWVILYLGHNDYARLAEVLKAVPPWARALRGALRGLRTYRLLAAHLVKARRVRQVWDGSAGMTLGDAAALWRTLPTADLVSEDEAAAARGRCPEGKGRLAEFEAAVCKLDARLEENLRAMIEAARGAGARVLVVTPVTRSRGLPPWRSEHLRPLAPEEAARWAEATAAAEGAAAAGRPDEAARRYAEALRIDPSYAGTYYGLAVAEEALGDRSAAARAHRKAKDWDLSGRRIHSRLVETIRRLGRRDGAELLDLEAEVRECEACDGEAYFRDELHPTPALHDDLARRLEARIAPWIEARLNGRPPGE